MNAVTMPFGKYRGYALSDVPDGYLRWLAGIDLQEPLRAHVAAELRNRQAMTRTEQAAYSRAASRARRSAREAVPSPEQVAAAALDLVDGTPAALMFGQVAALLVDAEVTAAEPMDVDTRRDLDSLAGQLQIVRSCLINMGRTSKRLTARRAAAVGTGTMDTSNAA